MATKVQPLRTRHALVAVEGRGALSGVEGEGEADIELDRSRQQCCVHVGSALKRKRRPIMGRLSVLD